MNQLSIKDNAVSTMTSIELVAIINEHRDEGAAELRHDNFMAKIEKHPGIAYPEFLGHVEIAIGNGATRKSKCYNLPKREAELMVMSESLVVQTRVYDRMTALETGKAQPAFKSMHSDPAARALMLAGMVSDAMNLQGSARLGTMQRALQLTAPEFLPILPCYGVDAPTDSVAGSSATTHSLTYLLKQHKMQGSTASWNKLLQSAGMLHQMTRPSRSKGEAVYWAVTEAGLYYGKNVTNPNNQLETQPHWYDAKFLGLVDTVTGG